MRDVVLALFWLGALPLSFMNPAAGMVFWVWDALFSPTELTYGFMQNIETNKLIAIVTMISFAVAQKKRRIYFDRTAMVLLALTVLATCSYTFSLVQSDLGDALYSKLLKEIVLAFAIMYLINTKEWLYLVILSITVALGFLGVKEGLIAILTAGGHKIVGSRATGDNNQLAAMLVSTIPFMYAMWRCTFSRTARAGFFVAISLTVVTVIMSYSRGAFVGLLVLGLLFLKGSRHRVLSLVVLALAGVALLSFAPTDWFQRVDSIQDASSDSSFMGRVVAWKLSWLIATDNPILGGGFHAVQLLPVWQHYGEYFHQLDFIPTDVPDVYPHAAHSIYFEVLGDLGFTGLFLYLLMLYFALSNCSAARKAALQCGTMPWMVEFSEAVQRGVICFMVTGLALSIGYYELTFVMVAISACCRQIALRHVAETSTNAAAVAAVHGARLPQLARMPTRRRRIGAETTML